MSPTLQRNLIKIKKSTMISLDCNATSNKKTNTVHHKRKSSALSKDT